ncbi:MAG: DNA-3-methyladenine glycosylase [Armatimonadota bacterium]|nr:DNA-3-methyladenine glycosylase [Armatimonadota bacterium]
MDKLSRDFYLADTIEVAVKLLGKILVHRIDQCEISGRIVETEAYLRDDPACHASRGMTARNAAMFGEPGHAYVYATYGNHYCLNVVTQPVGVPEAVLIRAVIPLSGVEIMQAKRNRTRLQDLCSGPAKLTQAMGITLELNGIDLLGDRLFIADDGTDVGPVVSRPRIGIRVATEKLWRFYPVKFAQWVSKR